MKIKLDLAPNLVAAMAAEIAAGEKAVSAAMRVAGADLKFAWRGQITGAGLGTRLAKSIRLASFPKSGESLNAAALVWSNAPVIVGGHDTGPLIRSKSGFWLAIPTPAAGKSTRGGRISHVAAPPPRTARQSLQHHPTSDPPIKTYGGASQTNHWPETRQINGAETAHTVKLRKRLDLARDAERAVDGVPGLIVANWVERTL